MQSPRQSYRILAASCAQLGRMAEARAYVRKQLEAYPDFDIDNWANIMPDAVEEVRLRYIEGLRKAGL
jgi:adenylate cyclase